MDKRIILVKQKNESDCGIACLSMIFKYYNDTIDLNQIRKFAKSNKYGATMLNMSKAAQLLGYDSYGLKGSLEELINENVCLPCIAHIITKNSYEHYVVISKIEEKIHIMDPVGESYTLSYSEFEKLWTGHILVVLPLVRNVNNSKIKTLQKRFSLFNQNNLTSYFSVLKKFKLEWIKIFVISLLANITGISAIIALYALLNMIQPGSPTNKILLFALFLATIYILEFCFNTIRVKWISKFYGDISRKFMCRYSDHLVKSDYSVFDEYTSGDLISRIQDADVVREAVAKTIVTFSLDAVMMLIAIVVLILSSVELFPLAIITVLIYAIAIYKFNTPIYKITEDLREADASVTTQLFENIGGIETIKSFQQENHYSKKSAEKISSLIENLKSIMWISSEQVNLSTLISSVSEVAIIATGIILINKDLITFSSLYIFYALFNLCLTPIKNLVDLIPIIKKGEVSASRLDMIFDIEEENYENANCDIGEEISIKFKDVDFAYGNGITILHNFNLDIEYGRKILINGKNGSGKSTLVKLLLNLYKPSKGAIYLNDIDVNKIPISLLRDKISIVSQDCFVFRGKVIENIRFGNSKLSDNEIISMIEKTPLHEMIEGFSNGYDTIIAENGDNISGGQRQIICLARAIIKESSILILDEATSALDFNASESIMTYLLESSKKTIICISHGKIDFNKFDEVYTLL